VLLDWDLKCGDEGEGRRCEGRDGEGRVELRKAPCSIQLHILVFKALKPWRKNKHDRHEHCLFRIESKDYLYKMDCR
jgi:hypothetical protein